MHYRSDSRQRQDRTQVFEKHRRTPMDPSDEADDRCLTVADVASRLNVKADTVRRLFGHEPGVIVICTPRKGRRVYRTLRIPEHVFRRVVMRMTVVD
jgi:hypothetical protein